MADQDVRIVIGAVDDTRGAFGKVEAEMGRLRAETSRLGSATSGLSSQWGSFIRGFATVGSLAVVGRWLGHAALEAAQFEEQMAALNGMTKKFGTSAESLVRDVQAAGKGMISMAEAADVAGTAIMRGISPERVRELASAAETFSNVTGESVAEVFRNLSEGVGLGREKAIERYTGALKFSIEGMTEAERISVLYTTAMMDAARVQSELGDATESAADKWDKLKTNISDATHALGEFIKQALVKADENRGASVGGVAGGIIGGLITPGGPGTKAAGAAAVGTIGSIVGGYVDMVSDLFIEAWRGKEPEIVEATENATLKATGKKILEGTANIERIKKAAEARTPQPKPPADTSARDLASFLSSFSSASIEAIPDETDKKLAQIAARFGEIRAQYDKLTEAAKNALKIQGIYPENLSTLQESEEDRVRDEADRRRNEEGDRLAAEATRRRQAEEADWLATDQRINKVFENARARAIALQEALEMREGWSGLLAGLQAYADQATNLGEQIKNAIVGAFTSAENAIVQFTMTGKTSLSDLANSIIEDILRIYVRTKITGPIAQGFMNYFGSMGSGYTGTPVPDAGSGIGGYNLSANGNIMTADGPLELKRFASGGIARRPMLSIFGEGSRPEAYVPLPDGRRIPVALSGAGGANVQVNVVNNASGTKATASERQDGSGGRIVDVLIDQVRGAIAGDILSGSGLVPAAMGRTYGLNRAAGAY